MRYKPTIHLFKEDIEALRRGALRIQIGQWVMLPNETHKSRYIGINQLRQAIFEYHPISTRQFIKSCTNIVRYKFTNQILLFV